MRRTVLQHHIGRGAIRGCKKAKKFKKGCAPLQISYLGVYIWYRLVKHKHKNQFTMSKSSHESWKVSVLDKAATKYERNASALLEAISATQLAALIEDNNSDLFTELLVKTVELIECMLCMYAGRLLEL